MIIYIEPTGRKFVTTPVIFILPDFTYYHNTDKPFIINENQIFRQQQGENSEKILSASGPV